MLNEKEALIEIEKIFSEDAGGRGIGKISLPGDFERALKDLSNSNRVIILTGFVIRDAKVGETDGPLGTMSIAKALEELGKEVLLVTDIYSYNLLEEGKKIKGVKAKVVIVPYNNANEFAKELYKEFKPDHFLSIERPGKAANGKFHSMRGEDLSDIVPDTDALMLLAIEKGIRTTAVGDGGNELGMGKIKHKIIELINHGEKIAAEVAADNLILAGVSNWGGHGLAAGLSIICKRKLIHDKEVEKNILDVIVQAGSVDGCTKEKVSTVDGLSLEKNLNIIEKMNDVLREYLS